MSVEAEWMSRVETQVEGLKEETSKLRVVQLDLVKPLNYGGRTTTWLRKRMWLNPH